MAKENKLYDEQKAHALAAQMWKELGDASLVDENGNKVQFTFIDLIAAAGFFVHDVMMHTVETTDLTCSDIKPLIMSIMEESSKSGIEDLLA